MQIVRKLSYYAILRNIFCIIFCIFNFTNNLLSLHHAGDSPPRS
ncbi:hypothetical protein HMPREF1581_01056 [Gardnerella vaginalis JCP8108]|uniref:Uncharacterized protein n=1 Tax=Gardnerella vaginalis JCP8108 TaxID=1261066 RepID=S4HZT7_GARVA|nr:hypothetical protein HMPREF1581_01056 [Gardnerella vaginalis JCP8108]